MSSPTPSYIPYTPKRHSTQSSIASLSQIQHNPSSSSSSSSSRAPSHHRTSSSQSDNNSWLKSPQPQRYSLERPLLVNQHHWNSQSSSQSTITTTGTASYQRSPLNAPTTIGSPIPHNTLPFSPSPRLQAPPQPSTSTSPSPSSSTTPHQSTIPYLTSFQPPGVKRNRTEQFIKLRQGKRRETLGEEERLERRLDKVQSHPHLSRNYPTKLIPSISFHSYWNYIFLQLPIKLVQRISLLLRQLLHRQRRQAHSDLR